MGSALAALADRKRIGRRRSRFISTVWRCEGFALADISRREGMEDFVVGGYWFDVRQIAKEGPQNRCGASGSESGAIDCHGQMNYVLSCPS